VVGQGQGALNASWDASVFVTAASSSPQASVITLRGERAISRRTGDEAIRQSRRSLTKPRGLPVPKRPFPCDNEGGGDDKLRRGLVPSCDDAALKRGDGVALGEIVYLTTLMVLGAGVDILGAALVWSGDQDNRKTSMDGKLSAAGASAEPSMGSSCAPVKSET